MSEQNETENTIGDVPSWTRDAQLKEGTRLDRYQILGLLGRGGMGAVYKAYDPELDRSIAIKILTVRPEEGETASRPQARLMREAQALAKLSHPNVVSVFDVGTFEEGVYIAMEYVKGRTLREWLTNEKPPRKEIISTLSKAGQGLQAAHTEGIVHRDFKPDNVIIGDRGQVKVLDFGLARAAGAEESAVPHRIEESVVDSTSGEKLLSKPLTRVGAIIGTTVYMAPEHFRFQELDEKTDQFSFGVTLFEALCGKRPFAGKTSEELEKNITSGWFEIPREADVPKWIEAIIHKGLSVSKEDRYGSMSEMLDALGDDPEIAKTRRRKKIQLASLILILTAMTLGFGYYALFGGSRICTGADKKSAGVWNEERKQAISQAFTNTGLAYAKETLVRVAKRFDEYLGAWKRLYTETCEATRVRGEQSEEIMDLKMGCLQGQLQNAAALVDVLGEADKTAVLKSVQAVSSMSGLSHCNDIKALQSRIPLPKDAQTRIKVASIRKGLSRVEALSKTGKYQKGLEQTTKLEQHASEIEYKPLQAQVLFQLGEILFHTGDYKSAEKILSDSAIKAGQSRDAHLASRAMARLVGIVGYQLARPDAGLSIARDTEVILGFARGDERTKIGLFNNLGTLYYRNGSYQKALEHYRKSLALMDKELQPEHYSVASVLNNIGSVLWKIGEYEKALVYYLKALDMFRAALGSNHPHVAYVLMSIGEVFRLRNEYNESRDYYRKSLEISEESLGEAHPLVAQTLNSIGNVCSKSGNYDKALEYLRRALLIREKTLGSEHPDVAETLHELGNVFQDKAEHEKSLFYHRKALAIWRTASGSLHPDLAWPLASIGKVLLMQGKPQKALEYLEQLLNLCEKKSCDLEPYGNALFVAAKVQRLTSSDRNQSRKWVKQARELFGKTPKRFKKELEEIDSWLKKQDSLKSQTRYGAGTVSSQN